MPVFSTRMVYRISSSRSATPLPLSATISEVLIAVSPGCRAIAMLALEVAETVCPLAVPVAVAVLSTAPASTCACEMRSGLDVNVALPRPGSTHSRE